MMRAVWMEVWVIWETCPLDAITYSHHNDALIITIKMKADEQDSGKARLTVTLAPGQRPALEAIAAHNETTLSYVVRYALRRFIEEHGQGRIPLEFPNDG